MPHALIYHDVADAADRDRTGFPGPVAARYKLTPDRFEAHLDAIAGTGAEIGLWGAPTTLTFDDGGASAIHTADALERRGWRGLFFMTTSRIGTEGFLSADGVRELADRGHGVGSHSHTHPTYFGHLDRAELATEWTDSRELLAELLGQPPAGASVPGGLFTPRVAETARDAGYEWLMTSEPESRIHTRHGIPVAGRYSIKADTSPGLAAAYARGAALPKAKAWVSWNAKQRMKRLSPSTFERLRRTSAGRSR